MNIFAAKRIESNSLKRVSREFSRLFKTDTYVDDQKFLEEYGIYIPGKKNFPKGYIKLWPQDFIVEEISLDGDLQSIYHEKFLSREKEFSREDSVLYATLVKCGLSTIEAAEELAKDLNIETENIKFAGIKDKYAITSQLISLKGINAEKLQEVADPGKNAKEDSLQKQSPYLFIKNVSSGRRELFIGGLKENQFTILVRTEHYLAEDKLLAEMKRVEKEGFYNYYYLQRFGIPRLKSPMRGLLVLKGEYEKVIFSELCQTGERELPYFQALRNSISRLWGNWEEIIDILDSFPLTFQAERKMINYLIKNPGDFTGALNEVPEQVRLWVDSFVSLLFNKKLASYLKEKQNLPEALPFFLSPDKRTWLFYKDLLEKYEVFSMPFALKNLAPFPFVRAGFRERETKARVKILDYKVIPEGIILNFNLPKGSYATTFLSHLFDLLSGVPSRKISNLPIDTKANIKKPSLASILNQFQDVVYLPAWKYSWRIY